MKRSSIKTADPFESIFPINADTLNNVAAHMEEHGFDPAFPIVLWKEKGVVVDGHTRLMAAEVAEIDDVPVVERSFADEDEAVLYAIHCQRDRRNLSAADLIRWIAEVDKRKTKSEAAAMITPARDGKTLPSREGSVDKPRQQRTSAAETAEAIGVSRPQIERARYVQDHAPEEIKERIASGEIKTIGEAHKETVKATRPHVANNSGETEWYTPADIIGRAREAMGGIDCDPASHENANAIVGAEQFFTKEDDGLSRKWRGRVWMNPPYNQPDIARFVDALVGKYSAGEIQCACVLVNNATETGWFQRMLSVARCVCFPAGRIRFVDKNGIPGSAPLQGQAIIYLGDSAATFRSAFDSLGTVLVHE